MTAPDVPLHARAEANLATASPDLLRSIAHRAYVATDKPITSADPCCRLLW
ncbi:hypothetical protein [Streptomyces sp. NPDC046909]|uniref:hypothetical protein n=1 Tax=Streptomyces sp. NPDC046909 TaxID=3155617 RepID=UPI0033D7B96C